MKQVVILFAILGISIPCTGINSTNSHPFKTLSVTMDDPDIFETNSFREDHFVPNEIIVKFKKPVSARIADALLKDKKCSDLNLSASLDTLNRKYKLEKTEAVFKNFKKHRQDVQALQKKDHSLLTMKEKHILMRLHRADKDAKVPELDRIYKHKFKLGADEDINQVLVEYRKDADVEYAELNYIVSICTDPNDVYYPVQWALNNVGQNYPISGNLTSSGTADADIDAPEGWDVFTGEDDVIVAVVDTGVDYNHSDLVANLWLNQVEATGTAGVDDDGNGYIDDIYGYDFINNDSNPLDDNGHGTHCSGIIAAQANNSMDIAGLCQNAQIMGLKFLGSNGSGTTDDAVNAFYYAVANGADVVSNSWGGGGYLQSMQDAINYAYSQGVIMIASAGNNNSSSTYYPACYENMISVASTDSDDIKASTSSYGGWVDISAPGVDILSLRAEGTDMYLGSVGYIPGDRFIPYGDPDATMYIASGTSMACPYAAGLAAMVVSQHSGWSNSMVTGQIVGTTDDIDPLNPGYSGLLGSGRINAYNAMTTLPQPSIVYQGKTIYDDFPGNNVNGNLDPGETVELVVSLKNVWADAENVNVTLSTTDPLVTIIKGSAVYGNIDSGMVKDNDSDRFEFSVNSETSFGDVINFILDITATGYTHSESFNIKIKLYQLSGWPITIEGWHASYAPILSDINRDGKDEVIFGIDNELFIAKYDGTICSGWPQEVLSGCEIRISAVGDIDGDGDNEVVSAVNESAGIPHCYVYAWHFENGHSVSGWPKDMGNRRDVKDIALGNLDNNENDLEVVVVRENDGYDPPRLYVFKGDGSNISGWPVNMSLFSFNVAYIAIGDIDNNGSNEIVVATGRMPGWDYEESPIFAYRNNGTSMPGWPIDTNGYLNQPVLCNLDSDDELEIVVGSVTETFSGKTYAWKANGQNVPGWPVSGDSYYVTAGDIDNDAQLEIISCSPRNGVLKVLNKSGNRLWSKTLNPNSPASICDIDDDNLSEIIYPSGGDLKVLDNQGNTKPGFPIDLNYGSSKQPAIGDLDRDGDLEIVVIHNDSEPFYIYAFDLPGAKPSSIEWPMFKHDGQLTCNYFHLSDLYLLTDLSEDGTTNYADLGIFASHWQEDTREVYEPNEVGWWELDEGAGLVAYDSSVYGNDGTLVGNPVWDPNGQIDGALNFDGDGDYVEVIGYKGITGTQSRTCAAWIKVNLTATDPDSQPFLSWGNNVINGEKWTVMVYDYTSTANYVLRVAVMGGYIYGTTDLNDNHWHHLAAVLEDDGSPNADEIRLYVDGLEEPVGGSGSIAVNTASASNVQIGSFTLSGKYFKGLIDDARIYDVALTEEMIEQLYQGQQPSGLVCLQEPVGDFNGDCVVSMPDLLIFVENWLWEQ
jgi:subtilisin family serine protease